MTDQKLATRLDALETRVAFQEQTIEDLNTTITDQWQQIERLRRELSRLTDEMRELEAGSDPSGRKDPPPPHY